jgi:hypothetical protein
VLLGLAVLAAAVQAAAVPFTFSSGLPDGKIATASRPGPTSGPNQETETGDDFLLVSDVSITQASFYGLVPTGTAMTFSDVHVEIYRVFPMDSNVARTSGPPDFSTTQVPTRVNSPSDVAVDDLDSGAGKISFSVTNLGSFSGANSVDTGIHPKPMQTTGGDGPVSGDEVRVDVTFTPALMLSAGHYFFVPQVLLTNPDNHFLWLSALKPIVLPGTPFSPDLQSWIRNGMLDPDWLRVGTDIVGGATPPTFNAAFSLQGVAVATPTETPTVTTTATPTVTGTPVPQGGACATSSQCATGFCANGVCCDTACSGPLEQCNLPGRGGTCASTAAPSPALTPWGLMAASLVLAGVAAVALRRRTRSR